MQVQSTIKGKPTQFEKLDDFWIEEKRLEVKYEEPLGIGFSSNVYVGKLFGASVLASLNTKTSKFRDCKVVIKKANDNGNNESTILESEIELMKKIGYHEHIVPLLGWSIKQNKPCLVLELCEESLLTYVRENHDVQFKNLISILWQIVQGNVT
jgi:serine/threonine protein kinase